MRIPAPLATPRAVICKTVSPLGRKSTQSLMPWEVKDMQRLGWTILPISR